MKKNLFILLGGLCLTLFAINTAHSLTITMKRIVFEGPKRAEVLTIVNNSNKTETYRIGWLHYVMQADGILKPVAKEELPSNVRPASDMIRYAPRRITVAAKSSQQIRIMLRLPAGVADGEYRSHLWIRTEPDIEEIRREAEEFQKKNGSKQTVTIEMLPGVTMPIIVRKGPTDAAVEVQALSASQSPGFIDVNFVLGRTGSRSVYGDVNLVCNLGTANEFLLRKMGGIAVYTEVSGRRYNFRAERPLNSPSCSSLSVTFIENDASTRSKQVLQTQATVSVAQ